MSVTRSTLRRPGLARTLRRTGASLAAVALLGGALTACSDEYDSTTCGEYLDLSQSEQVTFVEDALDSQASDEEVADFESLGDDGAYEQFAAAFVSLCESEDSDKTLGEISEDFSG
ncbi:hypothetical protein BH09ACT12_BH09ACT12_19980 [soil metagenome]